MRHASLAAALVVVALIAHAQAQSAPSSWPGLWGPARNGEARSAPQPPRLGKRLWHRAVSGGYSEIAVAGGRAITTELRGADDYVVALDAATGREQWTARIAPTYKGHDGSDDGPIGTPAIDGEDVFATGPNGHLVALDAATGRVRWRHDLVRDYDAQIPGWGFGSSPLVTGDLVVVPTGGPKSQGLLAFDRASGRLRWNASHAKAPAYSSAVLATIGGVRQIVAGAGDLIYAVAPGDGRLLWSIPGLGAATDLATSPIVLPAIACCTARGIKR